MKLDLIKENEDGSVDYAFTLTEEEKDDLIRFALISAIQYAVEKGKSYDPSKFNVGDPTSGGEDSVHGSGEQSSKPEQSSDGFKTSQVLG